MSVSALAPNGRELIDFRFYREYSRYSRLEIPGNILLVQVPDSFDLILPEIQVGDAVVPIPIIHFSRIDHWECVPLFVNY